MKVKRPEAHLHRIRLPEWRDLEGHLCPVTAYLTDGMVLLEVRRGAGRSSNRGTEVTDLLSDLEIADIGKKAAERMEEEEKEEAKVP